MSPYWSALAGRLHFPHLDSCPYEVHALGFRVTDVADTWTGRFNAFKFAGGAVGRAAVRGACRVMPMVAASIGLSGEVAVVSAIASHDEALDMGSPLNQMAAGVAAANGWRYVPERLGKKKHAPRHNMKESGIVRDAVVRGAYSCAVITEPTVVVVDDFATRGATIADIARAVHDKAPSARILGLVLGKNERVGWMGASVNNTHIPENYDQLWLGA